MSSLDSLMISQAQNLKEHIHCLEELFSADAEAATAA
jgi:hypothetical protein